MINRQSTPARVFADLVTAPSPTPERRVLDRAVVMGGSVAGLLAARVLADVAGEVVIVERDVPDPGPGARNGVPQGMQVHALLAGGRLHLERWFPGFTKECVAEGAFVAPGPDLGRAFTGRHRPPRDADTTIMSCSRPFLEERIRRRVLELPAVTLRTGRATGLAFSGGTVSGVHVETDGGDRVERADLVVDATGRASRLGDWLERGGWQRPRLVRLPIDLHYATGYFRPQRMPDPPMNLVRSQAGRTSGGIYGPVERGRYIVMISGYGDDQPAGTLDGFREQLRADLPAGFTAAAAGEPDGPVHTFHMADSRRRTFEPDRLPARLVAVGDAVASFNPVYGQGMTSAALHARCLEEFLADDPDLDAPAHGFFARQRVVVDAAWRTSTIADVRRTGAVLPLPRRERLARLLTGLVLPAAPLDRTVQAKVVATGWMLTHPDVLITPAVLARVAAARGRTAGGRALAAARRRLDRRHRSAPP